MARIKLLTSLLAAIALNSCAPPQAEETSNKTKNVPKAETKIAASGKLNQKTATQLPATPPAAKVESKKSASSVFDKTLKLQGISFHVQCPNSSSLNKLTLTPKGLKGNNSAITIEADGTVTNAEVADINGDGSPEIYISVTSAGSGGYGSLIAYSVNNLKSLTPINVQELSKEQSKGYMGHDEFTVLEGVIGRRFPTYKGGDTNANATGKIRQIQYKLKAGEASWQLVVDKVSEF